MPIYFNNCRGRDHARLFGPAAFYDLNTTGHHAGLAADLKPGTECVVATPGPNGAINFGWFAFAREQVMSAEGGRQVRVFLGEHLRSESLPKAEACASEEYGLFFTVLRHFKRLSVVPSSPKRARAKLVHSTP